MLLLLLCGACRACVCKPAPRENLGACVCVCYLCLVCECMLVFMPTTVCRMKTINKDISRALTNDDDGDNGHGVRPQKQMVSGINGAECLVRRQVRRFIVS